MYIRLQLQTWTKCINNKDVSRANCKIIIETKTETDNGEIIHQDKTKTFAYDVSSFLRVDQDVELDEKQNLRAADWDHIKVVQVSSKSPASQTVEQEERAAKMI